MKRPITTLFMLSSIDGKISTGSTDNMDVDTDYPKIAGLCEGLDQYYEIEATTDLWSICSGRTHAKIGVNERELCKERLPVSFVIIDNKNLTEQGVRYLSSRAKNLVIVTTNKEHPAFKTSCDNMDILLQDKLDLEQVLDYIAVVYKCDRVTIQTGGELNSLFLRRNLIDNLDIVMAPALIGGRRTATLIDGDSLEEENQLSLIKTFKFIECTRLRDNYIRLRYSK